MRDSGSDGIVKNYINIEEIEDGLKNRRNGKGETQCGYHPMNHIERHMKYVLVQSASNYEGSVC